MVVVVAVALARNPCRGKVEARGPGVQDDPVLLGYIVSLRPTQAT